MAAESSRSSTSSADSYIGSLISLTSKSEIRYEGILYNINTEESSIGLRNVRSFGSEGRKKDGPQIMPSDKVYEYILFRGSDIKDLQVKTSPPIQPAQSINNDPAIIQSHYPRPPQMSPSLPAAAPGNSMPDPIVHNPQLGHPGPSFQGGMPLYQSDVSMGSGSWGPSPPPPNVNSSGLAPPMYWPGFYAPPNGLPVPPSMHQQPLFRPTPPPSMQYPSFNASLPSGAPNFSEYSSSLMPNPTASTNLTSTSVLGSTLPPVPPSLTTEAFPNLMQTKPPNSMISTAPLNGSLPVVAPLTTTNPDAHVTVPAISNKPNLSAANLPARTTSIPTESPSLVTPGQLMQSGQAAVVSSESSQVVHKDVEPARTPSPELSVPVSVPTEAQPPILPLPTQSRNAPKTNGAPYQNRHSYRGRERGRGSGGSRPVMNFTEEFDFTAMNEKFNKDEVWGTLGKGSKSGSKDIDGNHSDEDELGDEKDASAALPKFDAKPVYSKDDFFDTLSSNSNDNQSYNGRPRFSEQMRLDTETFGEFSRYRGGRGGRGGRFRGGGYRGRGYGYGGRGYGQGGRNPMREY